MTESLAELKADRILAEARREARSIVDAARVDARREARGIVDAARAEAEGIITEAFEERARIVRRDWAIGDLTTSTDEADASTADGQQQLDEADESAEVAAGTTAAEVPDEAAGPNGDEGQADQSVAARAPEPGSAGIEDDVEGRPPTAPPDRIVPVPAGAASRASGSTSVLGDLIESPGFVEPFRRPLRRADAPAARDSSPTSPPRVWPSRLPRPGEPVPPPNATPQVPPPPPPARLPSRLSSQSSPARPPVPTRSAPGDRRIPAPPPTMPSPPSRLPSRTSRAEAPPPSPPVPPRTHPESELPPSPPSPPDRASPSEPQAVARRRVERQLPAGMRIPPDVPDWDDPVDDEDAH